MKKVFFMLLTTAVFFASCKESTKQTEDKVVYNQLDYQFFGQEFEFSDNIKDKEFMLEKYQKLKQGDTLEVAFLSDIKQVCQKKGCWMSLSLDEKQESFVKFQDYSFFAPMNASGYRAIVNGKAFVSIIPQDELKHYAKDAGKTQEEIDQITEDKVIYNFLAQGIAIEKEKQEPVPVL